jgi:hypothetical protein
VTGHLYGRTLIGRQAHTRTPAARWGSIAGLCLLAVLALGVLPGCAGLSPQQAAATVNFARATGAVADVAGERIASVRRDVIELRTTRRAIESQLDSAADAATGGVTKRGEAVAIDIGVTAAQAEIRLQAMAVLRQYADLLGALAADEPPAVASAAAGRVSRALLTWSPSVSESQRGIIGDAAGKLANLVVTSRRKDAARDAAIAMAEPVRVLLRLIGDDFDPEKYQWFAALRLEGQEATRLARTVGAMAPVAAGKQPEAGAVYLDPSRFAVLSGAASQLVSRAGVLTTESEAARQRLVAALGAMVEAHDTLLVKLQDPELITGPAIDRFLDRAEELVITIELYRTAK